MEAGRDSTGGEKSLSYVQYHWGDGARGTKAQLQALGIGENVLFPGEPGGPKRSFRTTDPRGFPVTVRAEGDGQFWAAISFPGRQRPSEEPEDFAPGVTLKRENRFDEYVGTPEALEAAGIALAAHMPGKPGMRRMRVSILPDGGVLGGAPTANSREMRGTGAKQIERHRGCEFVVRVVVSDDERERRSDALRAAEDAWSARMNSLPRPSPLLSLGPNGVLGNRFGKAEYRVQKAGPGLPRHKGQGHLRLVGGRDFSAGIGSQTSPVVSPATSARREATGWPLSEALLAALRRADPEALQLIEGAARGVLNLPPATAQ